jgi:diguanylate cyclase (GGDEF)-like protein
MMTLDSWLYEKRQFVLVFADLDSLKYINDEFGHIEGDIYIINAAKHLRTFSPDAIVCRIGGDEYMLLVPDISYDEAHEKMSEIFENFQNDEYLKDKTFTYSISFGIFAVGEKNKLSASDILGIADERMYENKRARKKNRQK